MNRRLGIAATAGALLAMAVEREALAQRTYRVGTLLLDGDLRNIGKALQKLGYEERRNIVFVSRDASEQDKLDIHARELVAANVDVIVAEDGIEAAKRATSSIPIVIFYALAPVELGLIDSLARPGAT